jgi:hypothetical protein
MSCLDGLVEGSRIISYHLFSVFCNISLRFTALFALLVLCFGQDICKSVKGAILLESSQ